MLGASWSQYIKFCTAALITMLAGAQTVHVLYGPLNDLEELVEEEFRRQQQEGEST